MKYGTKPLDGFTPTETSDSGTITIVAGTPTIQSEALLHEILTANPNGIYLSPHPDYLHQVLTTSTYFTGDPSGIKTKHPDKLDFDTLNPGVPLLIELTHGRIGTDFDSDFIAQTLKQVITDDNPLIVHTNQKLPSDASSLPTPMQQISTLADVIATLSLDESDKNSPYSFQITKCRQGTPMNSPNGILFEKELTVETAEQF